MHCSVVDLCLPDGVCITDYGLYYLCSFSIGPYPIPRLILEIWPIILQVCVPVNAIRLGYYSLLGPGTLKYQCIVTQALAYVHYSSPVYALCLYWRLRLYVFEAALHALILETVLLIETALIMEKVWYLYFQALLATKSIEYFSTRLFMIRKERISFFPDAIKESRNELRSPLYDHQSRKMILNKKVLPSPTLCSFTIFSKVPSNLEASFPKVAGHM